MKFRSVSKVLQVAGLLFCFALVSVGIGIALNLNSSTASASDCSPNAIMKCGFSTAKQFISNVSANTPSADLQTIYSSYGLTSADYSRFVSSAKPGVAHKDGTITVDGRVVGTAGQSIGRTQKSYSHAKVIGGTTYWESRAQDVFDSDTINVMVLFNAQGVMQFAVMNDCGNPIHVTPVVPTYACNDLQVAPASADRTTYNFTTSASAGNGASINHVVYNFGDGSSLSKTNATDQVTHTYAKPGTYNSSVMVYVNVPGTQTVVIAAAGNCVKQVVVPPPAPTPVVNCMNLTAIPTDNRTVFTFKATATAGGGATISGYEFHVRNSTGTNTLTKTVSTPSASATTTITIPDPGNYSGQVYVVSSLGKVTSPACNSNITVKPAPVADCQQLTVTPLDRTTYKLEATATATNGAVVQGYDFTIKDAAGKTVATSSGNTAALSVANNLTVTNAGSYIAAVTVRTNLGPKTGPSCTARLNVPEKPIPPVPSVKIEKNVDNQKSEQVDVGQTFTYHIQITNDGKVNLSTVAVTDKTPEGVTLLGTDIGNIADNNWSYTIPSLKIGQSVTISITAKVATYIAGDLINTACVTAPTVNPDHPYCDTASVTVTPPVTTPPVTTLPNTGAGNVIGIFAATVIASGIGYRIFLSRKLSR